MSLPPREQTGRAGFPDHETGRPQVGQCGSARRPQGSIDHRSIVDTGSAAGKGRAPVAAPAPVEGASAILFAGSRPTRYGILRFQETST